MLSNRHRQGTISIKLSSPPWICYIFSFKFEKLKILLHVCCIHTKSCVFWLNWQFHPLPQLWCHSRNSSFSHHNLKNMLASGYLDLSSAKTMDKKGEICPVTSVKKSKLCKITSLDSNTICLAWVKWFLSCFVFSVGQIFTSFPITYIHESFCNFQMSRLSFCGCVIKVYEIE